jgi:acetyl-CoA C-acetyltransferase
MPEAFIIDAVRTPVTRRGGGLAAAHPADLGAHVITALLARTQADPEAVDDVVFGCVDTVGPQAGDIARTAWLAAGLPEAVPGVTVDRQCGSSQQAVHFAAQAVLSGTADMVVAGGVQNMSMVPIGSAMTSDPFGGSEGWRARYGAEEISQFRAADLIAEKWGIGRGEMEQFVAPDLRQIVVRQGRQSLAIDRDVTGRRPIEPADEVEERRLARAGLTDDGDHFATRNRQRDRSVCAQARPDRYAVVVLHGPWLA